MLSRTRDNLQPKEHRHIVSALMVSQKSTAEIITIHGTSQLTIGLYLGSFDSENEVFILTAAI